MAHERVISAPPSSIEHACAVCGGAIAELSRCADCGVPQEVGGFKVLRQLARTQHSRMFLAERGGVRVALKEMLFALVPAVSQVDAFEREMRLLRQLEHPRIPRFVDNFKVGAGPQTRLYLAQEFVEGRSLLEELGAHRFDEHEARQIAVQVLEILRYLHGRSPQVIHRDLKPANLMRRSDGEIVLVDFGAARDLTGGVTHGSTLVGTFGYMPPEQLGGTVDRTADLYALGATLIHLLAQRPPHELMRQGVRLDFQKAIHVAPRMVAWLEGLVDPDRGARFKTAEAALDALQFLDRPSPEALSQNARPTKAQRERDEQRDVDAFVDSGDELRTEQWLKLKKDVLLVSTIGAMALMGFIFRDAILASLTAVEATGQGIYVSVESNIPVRVLVRHHEDEGATQPIEPLRESPIVREVRIPGVHLRDTIILENEERAIHFEHEVEFGQPGDVVELKREFRTGHVVVKVTPANIRNLVLYNPQSGRELGKANLKIELVEGLHRLELRGDSLKNPQPVEFRILGGETTPVDVVFTHLDPSSLK